MVEDPEDNVDTFCGCFNCNTGEDTEPVLIDFRVRNETNTHTRLDEDEDDLACEDEDLSDNLHKAAELLFWSRLREKRNIWRLEYNLKWST